MGGFRVWIYFCFRTYWLAGELLADPPIPQEAFF
jgi:hypothetical protein